MIASASAGFNYDQIPAKLAASTKTVERLRASKLKAIKKYMKDDKDMFLTMGGTDVEDARLLTEDSYSFSYSMDSGSKEFETPAEVLQFAESLMPACMLQFSTLMLGSQEMMGFLYASLNEGASFPEELTKCGRPVGFADWDTACPLAQGIFEMMCTDVASNQAAAYLAHTMDIWDDKWEDPTEDGMGGLAMTLMAPTCNGGDSVDTILDAFAPHLLLSKGEIPDYITDMLDGLDDDDLNAFQTELTVMMEEYTEQNGEDDSRRLEEGGGGAPSCDSDEACYAFCEENFPEGTVCEETVWCEEGECGMEGGDGSSGSMDNEGPPECAIPCEDLIPAFMESDDAEPTVDDCDDIVSVITCLADSCEDDPQVAFMLNMLSLAQISVCADTSGLSFDSPKNVEYCDATMEILSGPNQYECWQSNNGISAMTGQPGNDECEGKLIEVVVKKTVVEVPATVALNFGASFTVPDKDASAAEFGSFVNVLKDTLEATVGGDSKVKINSINGVAVENVERRRLAAGDVDIDFSVQVELKCTVTDTETCDNTAMLAQAEESFNTANAALTAVTPEALTTNLKAAVEEEAEQIIAAGGTPPAMLADVTAAADTITVEAPVVEAFDAEYMDEVTEETETVEVPPTPEPTSEPTEDHSGHGDEDDVFEGAAPMTTSSTVAVFVAGTVAVVAAAM